MVPDFLNPTDCTTQLSSSCKSSPRVSLNNMRRRGDRRKTHISWKLLFIGSGPGAISISLCRRPADPSLSLHLSLYQSEKETFMSNITLHYRLGWYSELSLCVWLNMIKNSINAEKIKYWRFLSKQTLKYSKSNHGTCIILYKAESWMWETVCNDCICQVSPSGFWFSALTPIIITSEVFTVCQSHSLSESGSSLRDSNREQLHNIWKAIKAQWKNWGREKEESGSEIPWLKNSVWVLRTNDNWNNKEIKQTLGIRGYLREKVSLKCSIQVESKVKAV